MTVIELFNNSLALMSESLSNGAFFSEFLIQNVNLLLADLFELENSMRDEETKLTAIPSVSLDTDNLVYSDLITRLIMPFGLARLFYLADDEYSKACMFETKYEELKKKYYQAEYVSITDVYSDAIGE